MEILSCSLCVSRLVGALAPCRRSGARLAQWRPSVLSLHLVFSLCTCALLLNIHLDSCDRTQAISFKQVISTAPSPTYCIPKVVRMETGELKYEKVYASPRPPPKISLKHDWMNELDSEVVRQEKFPTNPNKPKSRWN